MAEIKHILGLKVCKTKETNKTKISEPDFGN